MKATFPLLLMPDLSTVFNTSNFIPHGHCYMWQPFLVWLHLVSDSLIALAYYSIPLSLVAFARQRADLPFKWVFWLFGAFIVACGTTHLLDVWTLWHPTYWVSGGMKALTALLSIATAVMLFQLLPTALQLPSQSKLEAANAQLQSEIADRKQAETLLELQSVVTRSMAEGVCLVRAADGVIVYANPKFERMFGYAAGALEGQHVSVVNYEDATTDPVAVHQSITNAIWQHGEATYEVQNVKQDGTPFWCQATTSMFEHPEYDTVLVAVQQDITDRKQAEHTIRTSLKEKEVLLQEIHHRVKNNLQIVYSLLRLQRRALKDPQAAAILLESQNRIEAIALVHEKLYRAGDLAHIDASEYIPNLVVNLVSTYGLPAHQVQLELAIEPLPLSMDCAVPCGLMINELVSNAFKYAFPDQRPGQLTVSLAADTTDTLTPYVTLTVADNGVGLPAHVSLNNATTLGLQLVSDFVAQLHGTLQLDSTSGTSVQVRFPQTTLRQTLVPC